MKSGHGRCVLGRAGLKRGNVLFKFFKKIQILKFYLENRILLIFRKIEKPKPMNVRYPEFLHNNRIQAMANRRTWIGHRERQQERVPVSAFQVLTGPNAHQ